MANWLVPRRHVRSAPALRGIRPDFGLDEFDRLFADLWRGFGLAPAAGAAGQPRAFAPEVSIRETDEEIQLTAELPGLEEKDFEVHLEGDVLTLKGEKRDEHADESEGYRWVETRSGSFERRFQIPFQVDADAVTAKFEKGVLILTVPKPEEARPEVRTIPVTTG